MKNRRLIIGLVLAVLMIFGLSFLLWFNGGKGKSGIFVPVKIAQTTPAQAAVLSDPAANVPIPCTHEKLEGVDYKRILSVCSRADMESLLKMHPECVEYYLAMAEHLGGRSAWNYEAIALLGKAIEKFPEDPRLYALRARNRTMTFTESYDADLAMAAKDYSVLIRMHPEDITNYLNRCSALAISGHDPEQALSDCNYVISKATFTAQAYFYKGMADFHLKRYGAAIEAFSNSIDLDSDAQYRNSLGWLFPGVYYRAEAYGELGKYVEAAKDYEVAGAKKSDCRIFDDLAVVYARLGNSEKAEESLKKSVSAFHGSTNQNLYGWAIYYWYLKKDKQKALEYIGTLVRTADYWSEDYDEFLHDLYQTDEYKALKRQRELQSS